MLSVSNLSMKIAGKQILQDVSFDVQAGRVFGLVGESGSGKSLTALSAMGLLPRGSAVSGDIRLNETSLTQASERKMCDLRGREIGMIFQEPMTALNPMHRIGDQVAETLVVHKVANRFDAKALAAKQLERVGLSGVGADRFPHELSGGQRQRVAIAMAVALRPKLLIADEPTTALDVTTQAQILDLLNDLVHTEKMALWLITHDLAVVSGMADHVAVMRDGRLVESGPTQTLFSGPKQPYTRQLLADSAHIPNRIQNVLDNNVLQTTGVVRDYSVRKFGLFSSTQSFRAVDHVALHVKKGESVGLVGESGCGKSTLTRAILGLDPIQNGTVSLNGMPIIAGQVPAEIRAKMQVVFQDPFGSFNPRHKVGRLVGEPFHLLPTSNTEKEDRIVEALEAVGLSAEDKTKYIHEFSGGQRQRIAIARAIVIRPELVILDEAVSALDVTIRAQILDLLCDLQDRFGLSYLFISHDLSVVRSITDRVLVMKEGKIIEDGATEDVFNSPKMDYTQALIDAVPKILTDWGTHHV